MNARAVATANAFVSLVLGGLALVLPDAMGRAFGITLDPMGIALARMACAAYVGFGVLCWLARDLADQRAMRAVGSACAVAWGLGAVVVVVAINAGLGDARVWALVALQVVFALAWSLALARTPGIASSTASSRAS